MLMWSVWHSTGFSSKTTWGGGGGGGGKKLDTFLLYPFILSPFPSDAWTWLKYCLQTRFIHNWLIGHWIIANSYNIAVTFLGIRCVVTLDDFPWTSRPLKCPLPNIIMKLLVFPYLFIKCFSRMSNFLSLRVRFSISWCSPRYQGFARSSHMHRTSWRNKWRSTTVTFS